MNEELLKNVIIAYKMYSGDSSPENTLYLAMSLSEYGLVNDAYRFLLSYLQSGGSPSNLIQVVNKFPDEVKRVVYEYTKPTETKEEFDAQSYLEMADLLWDIGSSEDAKQNYARAISAFASKGELEKAENVLKIVKEKYPNDPEIQNFKIEKDNKILEVLQGLTISIPRDKEAELRYYLSNELLKEGLYENGIAEINKLRDIGGSYYKEGTKLLINYAISKGDFESAINLIDEVLSGEERLEYLYNIGLRYQEQGDLSKAMQIFNNIFSISPDFKDVRERVSPPKPKKEEVEIRQARVETSKLKEEKIEISQGKSILIPEKIIEENIIFI